jgi:peptide/nickel transport system permease protein
VNYLTRRLLLTIPLLLFVTLVTFSMLSLIKGDPAKVILGTSYTAENGAKVRKDLGLDKPFPVRYATWLGHTVRGDLGNSYYTGEKVNSALKRAMPVSIQLVIMGILMSLIISIPLGMISAYRAGTRLDRFISVFSFATLASPGFIIGILLIFIVALRLKTGSVYWFPAGGFTPFTENPLQSIRSLFLPALTIAIGQIAAYTRILRTDMAATLQDDYVLMAKAKGLSDKYILFRHAFRPSSFTLLTVAGVSLGTLLGNALIVESLFGLNGIGNTIARSVFSKDYPMILGGVAVITLIFVLLATVVDLLYAVIDPRVRFARSVA